MPSSFSRGISRFPRNLSRAFFKTRFSNAISKSILYPAEAKSTDAVLPNAAAGASAPMLRFESPASAGLSNFKLNF